MRKIPITDTLSIGGDEVFIIAEIGKNQIQSQDDRPVTEYLENAKKLVAAAKDAGADAVKFQTHEVEDEQLNINITSPHFTGSDRYSWVSRNTKATPFWFWEEIKKYSEEIGITFFSTPMSRKAAQTLEAIRVPFWKVGSGDVQDYVMIDYMIGTGKPIIVSNGMVSLAELDEVVKYITGKKGKLIILYCISQYPAPKEYFNLGTIEYLKEKYVDIPIGFSDHSLGNEIALAAVKLGAQVIEKHFSLSREFWGSDHKVSMTPDEFKAMVTAIRSRAFDGIDESEYYGDKNKELEGANNKFRPYFNKSLMAGCDIAAGTLLTKEMVYAMRPKMYANGLSAEYYEKVLGKRVIKNLKKFDPITFNVLQ